MPRNEDSKRAKKFVSFELNVREADLLTAKSKSQGMSRSEVLRKLVTQYLYAKN